MLVAKTPSFLKEALKSAADTLCSSVAPVQSITMVGGLLEPGSSGELGLMDEIHLSTIVKICIGKDIPIAADAKISVANLYYGDRHDFLEEQQPADMVVMSYLYYCPAALRVNEHGSLFTDGITFQSRHAADPDRWLSALVNTGARFAFNIVGSDRMTELPTEFIDRAPYRRVDTIRSPHAMEYDLLAR